MLPLLIRAAAARAGLFGKPVVLCWDLGGESPLHPLGTYMYSWFIDLYVPCTGYNLFKTLPIFMHLLDTYVAHMYSWFIDLYVPCTGYNLYKTLPIFMHAQAQLGLPLFTRAAAARAV